MKLNRENFGELLTPIHKKIIYNAYTEKEPQYTKLFKVDTMSKKDESYPHMGAFGMWASNTEGNTINESEMSQGDVAYFEAQRYDNGYSITWELVHDDLYNVMKGMGKGGSATALGKGLRTRIETNCADVINNGFSNTGYDGTSLFANDHPLADSTATGDNLITGALSDDTVKSALSKLRNAVDEAGLKIGCTGDTLFAAANKEWDAYTVIKSSLQSGNLINDKNVLPSLRIVIMDYLTDNYWGVLDSSYENLAFKWRDKPIFDAQRIPKTVDWFMYGYARFDEGYVDWRGIVGSTG